MRYQPIGFFHPRDKREVFGEAGAAEGAGDEEGVAGFGGRAEGEVVAEDGAGGGDGDEGGG